MRTVKLTEGEIDAVVSVAMNGISWEAILSICGCDELEAARIEADFERGIEKLARAAARGGDRRMRRDGI
jgi:hypothetical protein